MIDLIQPKIRKPIFFNRNRNKTTDLTVYKSVKTLDIKPYQKIMYTGMPTSKECAFCGKELFGRSDKAYCNDTCRNNGNRERRKKQAWYEPLFIRQINTILKRNYKILTLQGLDRDGPKAVSRYKLLDEGFNFHYFTSTLSTKAGDYHFIYDYGWRELEDGKIMVVYNPGQVEI